VVTLPGRSLEALRAEAERAARAGADIAEVRFDRLPEADRGRAAELFPSPVPLMATLRSRAEGGEGPDEPEARATVRRSWLELPFAAMDLERDRDSPPAAPVEGAAPVTWVWSYHAPTSRELVRALETDDSAAATSPAFVAKTVGPASVGELLRDVLPRLPPPGSARFVVHTTGPSGPLLRAWSGRLGMDSVYCALPEDGTPSAPVEASQIPVDRLAAYLRSGDGPGPLFAVVGHPIDHSLSPKVHARWMAGERRNGLYVALDMADGAELASAARGLADGGVRGINATHPLKRAALESADRADRDASACRCANTLRLGPGGTEAFNTDVAAMRRRLAELTEAGAWDGERAEVLGAGGAARAALLALRERGARATVRARREPLAKELAREFGAEAGTVDRSPGAALIVHATPAGRFGGGRLPADWFEGFVRGGYVIDFVYAPVDPFVRIEAERRGLAYEDGVRLLVYQAAASYGIWWGGPPSEAAVAGAIAEVSACAA
jgi:shikimate dehydrogenase